MSRSRVEEGAVLVVEDDPLVTRTYRRLLPRSWAFVHASTKGAAVRALEEERSLRLILLDLALGNDSRAGLELLDVAVARYPRVPRAIVTAFYDHAAINRTAARGAIILAKPLDHEGRGVLTALVEKSAARDGAGTIERHVAKMADAWRLSPTESRVLTRFVARQPRAQICSELRMSLGTLKNHVLKILLKAGGANSMQDLVAELLAGALEDT